MEKDFQAQFYWLYVCEEIKTGKIVVAVEMGLY